MILKETKQMFNTNPTQKTKNNPNIKITKKYIVNSILTALLAICNSNNLLKVVLMQLHLYFSPFHSWVSVQLSKTAFLQETILNILNQEFLMLEGKVQMADKTKSFLIILLQG